jgi:hypothetical protein
MHHFGLRVSALLIFAVALQWVSHPSDTPSHPLAFLRDFEISFAPGRRDDTGNFMGGTEMRVLADHGGKLFAGNGYWEDRPGPEDFQGAQILVLDAPSARWRTDHTFDERMARDVRATSRSRRCGRCDSLQIGAARSCRSQRRFCSPRFGT